MKRFFTLTLTLLMMLQVAAFAETATAVYTDPDTGYQLPHPEGWHAITKDTIEDIAAKLDTGEVVIEGMNAEVFISLRGQMEQIPLAMFRAPSGGDNMSLYYIQDPDAVGYTLEQLLAESGEGLLADLSSSFTEFTPLDAGSIVTSGDNAYMHFSGKGPIQGKTAEAHQYWLLKGERVYCLTLTFLYEGDGELPEHQQSILDAVTAGFVPA